MKSCPQKSTRWLLNWVGLLCVIGQCHALDVFSRFRVEQGQGLITRSGTNGYGGSCYDIDADLSAIYTEAIDMAQVALDALNNYATSATVRASVQTFFGIKPDSSSPATVSASDAQYFTNVKNTFEKIVAFSTQSTGQTPGLFCDDSWRWKTQMMYASDGKMTSTSVYRETGEKIIAEGIPLRAALSIPATFMHELSHYVTVGAVTDVPFTTASGAKTTAYGPENVSLLARSSTDFATKNADSYTWFATAMYLDQCDWSRTICAKSTATSTVTARSDNHTSSYVSGLRSFKRRILFPRLPIDFESGLV
ncbi:hypothetical protein PENARI_c018G04463 [Penicillium arizonense]|uniref:Uncharacterized protein n=1 Tax=Penicillium arizonense TaxID=1835702 RepID=A0A1F5LB30_PENAI|nr:hypothetical protein PENARI_c018G04463 [Penicillium arizonense]OGE50200.1 hypothetical protein PENARI_c018G04463 [Penicillium arizonense]